MSQNPKDFSSISIAVASPEEILSWSYGEVVKPETINYRTQKAERGGLFCEKIFGPTKNWECYCGKYKGVRYKGIVCEKCGVEVTRNIVRRERMGHIKLAVPVSHIWYLKTTPSRLGLILDISTKQLEQVIYFASYIVTSVDDSERKIIEKELTDEYVNYKKQIKLDYENELSELQKATGKPDKKAKEKIDKEFDEKLVNLEKKQSEVKAALLNLHVGRVISEIEYRDMSMKFGHVFTAESGAAAIRDIISRINIDKFIEERTEELKTFTGQKYKKTLKRLQLIVSLKKANIRPEWMVMTVLPVLPPDLRPMVQLDGGRYAASDLNDLYRRVINRNNRLKRLLEIDAPDVICRNEKRMLQESVDMLLNIEARKGKDGSFQGGKKKLRSLSDMLKGKQGRFRQNLLGKRVDYSGRSVIVVGPELELHQCGLPKEMAMKLFRPFVIGKLIEKEYAYNIKSAEKIIQSGDRIVWDLLEDVTKNHYVLLNRAPTLHRLGIQAFQPVLIEGRSIRLHPLVCSAFNADFDGDQMGVHVPLSKNAQYEAKELMLASKNLLKPAAGKPVINPSQEIVLGCYYMTIERDTNKERIQYFGNFDSLKTAYDLGQVGLHEKIKYRFRGNLIETTTGRAIFNEEVVPEGIEYKNIIMRDDDLSDLLSEILEKIGPEVTAVTADKLKKIGFLYATVSGLSLSQGDMNVPEVKEEIMKGAEDKVRLIGNMYYKGYITARERYMMIINVWQEARGTLTKAVKAVFSKENPFYIMQDSGARGNWGQISQICGMKGVVAGTTGKLLELPVRSSFKEGFSILEYFIASHSGRKGKADTALKTAEAGYLTRKLVDSVQNVIVKEKDCGQTNARLITKAHSEKIGESFESRIFGRTIAQDLVDKKGEVIFKKGTQVNIEVLAWIKENELDELNIYSVLDCATPNGVCQKCYGLDLGSNKIADIGTPVGIIAAQSIGEPGTQLTMRTFHTGGVASSDAGDITEGLPRVQELFEAHTPKSKALLSEVSGVVSEIKRNKGTLTIVITGDTYEEKNYPIYGTLHAVVKKGDKIRNKQVIAKSDVEKITIKSEFEGEVVEVNSDYVLIKASEIAEKEYTMPSYTHILVAKGDRIEKGDQLTYGHCSPKELFDYKGIRFLQDYLMHEVQSIYSSQGQTINDKHFEIIIKQLFSKIRVVNAGDTELIPGAVVSIYEFDEWNKQMEQQKKKKAYGERLYLGLTKVALNTESWLSAASFQETIRCLVDASVQRKVDNLEGLKENVIIGRLIPAGRVYRQRVGLESQQNEKEVSENVDLGIS